MGKSSSAKAEVVEYRMSLHLGVGHELDAITEVRVDEKVAWRGNATTNQTISINQPNLFGGQRKEGGLVGTMQILMGRPDQVMPAAAASRYRRTPQTCPAFRGVTTIMFHGSSTISTGRPGEWDSGLPSLGYSNSGFLWKMNSAFIAQKIEVTGRRAPKGLDPATAMIGNDANPAHIIYESLVNDEWGMGGVPALINKAGFEAIAVTLRDEGFGLSLWWMRQQTIEAFITDILDHIQATLFINPNTGLLDIKLLRDDYDIATLRHITPDNAVLSNFKRRSSGEIVNEMTVSFTNPLNEQSESITAQDIASIESQGGKKVSGSRDYYGIRSRELATEVLQRDLTASTAPLISVEAKLDRSAWDILPGEVVLVSWPKRNTYSVVMRAGKVNYGKPMDSAVRVSLLQDVFSLPKPAIALLPGTAWEDPAVDPQPLTMRLFTVPAFFVRNAEIQTEAVELGDGEALVGALADSETYDSFDYELVSESVAANGDTVITSKGAKSMTPLGHLTAALPAAATSTLPFDLFPVAEETPVAGGFVFIGHGDTNQEIALVTGRSSTGWTIDRGVLDTVPVSWPTGTPVWVVNPGARIVDTQTIHAAGMTAAYRGLDRTSRGTLGYEDAPTETVLVTDRPHLPLRPANVRLNGVGFGTVSATGASSFTLAWATRNRLMEDTQVLQWTDGAIQPEYRQETVVRVYNAQGGALLKTYAGLWTETSLTFSLAQLSRYTSLRFEVLSRRDGLWSLTGHSITLTDLPGNPSGPLLPDGPSPTPPPSFEPAPASSAFSAAAVSVIGTDGSETPAIEITGTPDRLDVSQLVVQYRRLLPIDEVTGQRPVDEFGQPILLPWINTPTLPVRPGDTIRYQITPLAALTEYEVQVAYVVGGIFSMWRSLGTHTTGEQFIPPKDVTPPGVPGGLTVTSTATTDSQGNPKVTISVDWDDNVEDDFGFYELEISESGFTIFEKVTTSHYTFRGESGSLYTIRLRAVDEAGNPSDWSAPATVTGASDNVPPPAPTGLTVAASLGSFFLSWTNPSVFDLSKVEVWEHTSNASALATRIATVNAQAAAKGGFARSGLSGGDTRWYWLRAIDTSGNVSAFSVGASATIPSVPVGEIDSTPPGLPTDLTLTTSVDTLAEGQRVKVRATWTAPGDADIAGYEVEITEAAGNPIIKVVGGPAEDWVARANTLYTVRVRAFDRVGNKGAWTASVAITSGMDTTAPGAPTGLTTSASLGSIFLSWTNPSAVDLVQVEVWEHTSNASASATRIATVNAQPGAKGGFTRSGLSGGDVRWYWLKAVDTSGNVSSFSVGASGTIPSVPAGEIDTTPPGLPTGLSLTNSAVIDAGTGLPRARIIVTWTAPVDTDLAGYDVEVTEGAGNPVTRMVSTARDQWDARPNVTYSVRVRAFDRVGNRSSWTTSATITTAADSVAPAAPTGLAAVASVGSIFLSGTAPADADVAKIEIWENTVNNSATATRIAVVNAIPGGKWAHPRTGLSANDTRWYWAKAVDTSGNASGFSAGTSQTVPYVANPDIAVGTLAGDRLVANSVEGSVFKTNTSLPGTITVGTTGVTIETVHTRAADPAARINAQSTQIDPGKIVISGATTLADWRMGGDQTKIDGGQLSANTVRANAAVIGLRGINISGITFEPNAGVTNRLGWSSGTIQYISDAGISTTANIAAGTYDWTSAGTTGGRQYIYWTQGAAALAVTSSYSVASADNAILLGTYTGGVGWTPEGGRTVIDGGLLKNDTVDTGHLRAGAVTTNILAANSVTGEKVQANTFEGSVFKTNTSLPGTITVGTTGVSIETVHTRASDPAARINALSTQIDPGKIVISGSTTLADWRRGGDQTKIDGGAVSANTITANKLTIGARGVDLRGITFEPNSPGTNQVSWTGGQVIYTNDAGSSADSVIAAGSATWSSGNLYIFWEKGSSILQVSGSYSGATTAERIVLAIYNGGLNLNTSYGRTVIDGGLLKNDTVDTGHLRAGAVTTNILAANSVTGEKVQANSLEGSVFKTNTSLPGSITVGTTGVTIETVHTRASDPAARINALSTQIDPGKIVISGSTTLADWRRGGDQTKINGGAISANTIDANKLTIGLRGVAVGSIVFTPNAGGVNNRLTWSSGSIAYTNDAGAGTSVTIASGTYDWTSSGTTNGRQYVYWVQGASTLSVTSSFGTANTGVILGVYTGGANWAPDYGRTIIDGDSIQTGGVKANNISVTDLSAITANLGTVTTGKVQNAAGTTFFDLTNARSQYRRGSYDLRMGSIGSGVAFWYGLTSIAVGSETRTNGKWAFGDDGKVYYGASELQTSAQFHAQADHAVRIGTRTSAGQVTTSLVTITSSGATGTVTYEWTQIGGDETWTITSPSGSSTTFRVNVTTPGQQKRATFACLVKDSGSGRSFTITVGAAAIYNV